MSPKRSYEWLNIMYHWQIMKGLSFYNYNRQIRKSQMYNVIDKCLLSCHSVSNQPKISNASHLSLFRQNRDICHLFGNDNCIILMTEAQDRSHGNEYDLCPSLLSHLTQGYPWKREWVNMSDVLVLIYLIVGTGLVTAFVFHKATGHHRIFSALMVWAVLGVFMSTIGGLLILGTFIPNMASYNNTAVDLYNISTWGGLELPEYNETLGAISNLGIVINAMGLGVLIMTALAGFFPRSFFSSGSDHTQREAQ